MALIGLVLLGGVAIVLLLHRTGRVSFGYRLDQLLGGGRESVAVGMV